MVSKKAVVLARGLGKRMRASNENIKLKSEQAQIVNLGIKTLIPIAKNRTFLDLITENLRQSGFTEICLVIGGEHNLLKDFCRKNGLHYVIQKEPLGTADAVLSAQSFVKDDFFLSVNSDNLYPVSDLVELNKLDSAGLIAYEKQSLIKKSNIDEVKINQFAVLVFDENNHLSKIIEKPQKTEKNAFISMNAWKFSPRIFTACQNINPSLRGEFELSDAINFAIENFNEKFKTIYSNSGVLDLSNQSDIVKIQNFL